MKILFIIFLLFNLLLPAKQESKAKTPEKYIIGRFTVVKDFQGYQASTKDTTGLHCSTMYKAINAIK